MIAGNEALQTAEDLLIYYLPDAVIAGGENENISLLKNRVIPGKNVIYYCKDKVCSLPTDKVSEILEKITSY